MKLYKINKIKSLLLVGVLSLSLFFGGCSNNVQTLGTVFSSNATEDKNDKLTTSNNSSVPKDATEATIERVVDGDTMKLKLKNSSETVTLRLLLVDTPESVKPGVEPQPYSLEASDFAKKSLQVGDTVYIEYDDGDKTDKYDRHLGYLWYYSIEDNQWKMFNEKIIYKGLARVGYVYSQKRHLDRLYAAQDKAKSSNLNIWSVPGYVTDKGYDVEVYNKGGNKTSSDNNNINQSNQTGVVYANGGSSTSNKYHSSKDAHGMKGAIKMTESKAKSQGYVACKQCY